MAITSRNPAGRPVSEELTLQLHRALISELENKQFHELSLDGIAKAAGVARPTLYRRYSSISQLALATLETQSKASFVMPYTASLLDDLTTYLNGVATVLHSDAPLSRALRGVLAGALVDSSRQEPFSMLLKKRREPVLSRLQAEQPKWKKGEIEHIADLLFGPILYRVLIRQESVSSPLTRIFVAEALSSRAKRGAYKNGAGEQFRKKRSPT